MSMEYIRVKKMTPEEKLKRLTNPQCAEDYGLSISFDELASFDTGRAFLEAFNEIYVPFDKQGIINEDGLLELLHRLLSPEYV